MAAGDMNMSRKLWIGSLFFLLQLWVAVSWSGTIDLRIVFYLALLLAADLVLVAFLARREQPAEQPDKPATFLP